MCSQPHVALIGMMGSGKSTVGFWLAQSERLRFVDLDAAIEVQQGCPVSEIFEAGGEERFRDLEQAVLADCLESPEPLVISCGGGVVLRAENRSKLRSRAWVCWLRATVATLTRRVKAGDGRPLLGSDPAADLLAVNAARSRLYGDTAHEIVDVDALAPEQVAERIRGLRPPRPASAL